jgi:pSer/pThr/pTyr-binding forkhead associated (FHA) protein
MSSIHKNSRTQFCYEGNAGYPNAIGVDLKVGGFFTIGRFDASKDAKKSSFEFCRAAKDVSRQHAAVVRNVDGHSLVDLSSSSGTYLDGCKLQANIPHKLTNGCRVSFGYLGADYIWIEG